LTYLLCYNEVYSLCIYSIDASGEPESNGPRLGRLINHGNIKSARNAKMKILTTNDNQPTRSLFATRQIVPGEQILYDYGIKVPWDIEVCPSDVIV